MNASAAARARPGSATAARAVVGLTVLAAVVRFATLDLQSFWFDEALTLRLSRSSYADMLEGIRAHEANPPLYYLLARGWSRVFGDGEAGLRSLSALLGTLTVPVAYEAARTLVDRRTGLVAATLTACSPALVWYSQEARAYALLVFLCALSLLFFAQARSHGSRWGFAGWAVASGLALWSHYFAIFMVIPQAALLLARGASLRRASAAIGVVAAAAALVAPLAFDQRANEGGGWIAGTGFLGRLANVPFFFVTGIPGHPVGALLVLATAAAFVAAFVAVRRNPSPETRSGALVALGLGAFCVAAPVAGALLGTDYVLERNLLPAWLPLAIFAAAGLTSLRRPELAARVLAVIVVGSLGMNAVVALMPSLQRDDWRAAADELGPPRAERVVAVAPRWQELPLSLYRPELVPMRSPRHADEVVLVTYHGPVPFGAPRPEVPAPPFRRVRSRTLQRFTLSWYSVPEPVPAARRSFEGPRLNGSSAFVER